MTSEQEQIKNEIFDIYGIDISKDLKNPNINPELKPQPFEANMSQEQNIEKHVGFSKIDLLLLESLMKNRMNSIEPLLNEYKHLGVLSQKIFGKS